MAVDGLKLTIPGEQLRTMLQQRVDDHRERAASWRREQARTPDQQTEDELLLPDHFCANEAERDDWRIVERTTRRSGKPTEGKSHQDCSP